MSTCNISRKLLLCFNINFLCLSILITQPIKSQCLGNPHPFAIEDVSKICRVLNINYINVYTTTPCSQPGYLNNATTTTDAYGRTIIVYDPLWFEQIYVNLGRAANISILAHEVGHAYNHDNYYNSKSQWDKELQADYISGWVMARLGYSLGDALMAIRTLSRGYDNTHPPTSYRIQAITNGWNKTFN